MNYQVEGSTMQTLTVTFGPGEEVVSETGSLLHMSPNVELNTRFQGGLGGMFQRMVTGNSLALNHFQTERGSAEVSFTTRMPGHIIPFEIRPTSPIYVQRHSFLCATGGVDINIASTLNLFGLFGGNGLVITELHGNGQAFVSIDGEVITRTLEAGETLLIHPGHLAAFESTVEVNVQRMKGFKNLFFGGDGLALVSATGPGTVWMHSLSLHNLVHLLAEYGLGKR